MVTNLKAFACWLAWSRCFLNDSFLNNPRPDQYICQMARDCRLQSLDLNSHFEPCSWKWRVTFVRTKPFQLGEVETGVRVEPECTARVTRSSGFSSPGRGKLGSTGHRGKAWPCVALCSCLLNCPPVFLPPPLPFFRKKVTL